MLNTANNYFDIIHVLIFISDDVSETGISSCSDLKNITCWALISISEYTYLWTRVTGTSPIDWAQKNFLPVGGDRDQSPKRRLKYELGRWIMYKEFINDFNFNNITYTFQYNPRLRS
jgi:hypothetical protein